MAFAKAVSVAAGTVISAMYLDAKLLVRHDLTSGALAPVSSAAAKFIAERTATDTLTIYSDLSRVAKDPKTAYNIFLIFENQFWTYHRFWEDVNRVGKWLIKLGIEKEEIVALNGGNSPEYLLLWFALEAIGAAPAFINCNLTAGPLVHCLTLSGAKVVLVDSDVMGLVEGSQDELAAHGCQVVKYDNGLVDGLPAFDGNEVPRERTVGLSPMSLSSLIYTSGTTGKPKGTKMIRAKEVTTARGVTLYLGLQPGMRMYTCLPLYHGAAHGLCVTPTIFAGSTVVLSRKFSHKTFWPEVRESKAQILQYVGELCRYLINAPPSPLDKQNEVTMAWGNGMRPDVWDVFRDRFDIPIINELYAATDGLGGSFNYNKGEFGKHAIGKRGYIWNLLNGKNQKRVRIDVVSQEIVKDENGFAYECKDGEPGEVVHRLDPAQEELLFAGYYKNAEAGEKRKIRNLFEEGDYWFRSGDMMRQDPDGCVYFVDRLGDTFRWKSENVSTNEVGDVLGQTDQIAEANVYGIQVPHADGRCGCAAIVMAEGLTEDKFDFAGLARHAIDTLPRYAVPIFVRVVKELEYTGTMKVQKGKLREQGVDPDRIRADDPSSRDSIYWLPPGSSTYVPFNRKDWDELKAGKVKL